MAHTNIEPDEPNSHKLYAILPGGKYLEFHPLRSYVGETQSWLCLDCDRYTKGHQKDWFWKQPNVVSKFLEKNWWRYHKWYRSLRWQCSTLKAVTMKSSKRLKLFHELCIELRKPFVKPGKFKSVCVCVHLRSWNDSRTYFKVDRFSWLLIDYIYYDTKWKLRNSTAINKCGSLKTCKHPVN